MKKLHLKQRSKIWWQALHSACILSLFIYGLLRLTFFEFRLSWQDEFIFFGKFFLGSLAITYTITTGIAMFYASVLKLVRLSKASAKN